MSQEYIQLIPKEYRRSPRTQLSHQKSLANQLQKKKFSQLAKKIPSNSEDDLSRLREKYPFRRETPQHHIKLLKKCQSGGTLFRKKFLSEINVKKSCQTAIRQEHYLDRKMKHRHYKAEEVDRSIQNRLQFERKMIYNIQKFKSKSLGVNIMNYESKQKQEASTSVREWQRKNKENMDEYQQQCYKAKSSNSSISKGSRKYRLNPKQKTHPQHKLQQYDDYSLQKVVQPRRKKKQKEQSQIGIDSRISYDNNPYRQTQLALSLQSGEIITQKQPQNDYEKIKLLQQQPLPSQLRISNRISDQQTNKFVLNLGEKSSYIGKNRHSKQSIDSGGISRLLQVHKNKSNIEQDMMSNDKNDKKKDEDNISRIVFNQSKQTNSFNREQNALSHGQSGINLLETGRFLELGNPRKKKSNISYNKNGQHLTTETEPTKQFTSKITNNPKSPQRCSKIALPHLSHDLYNPNQNNHKNNEFFHSHKIPRKSFNLVQSIKLWYSYEENKLFGMNQMISQEQSDIKNQKEIIIDKVYAHYQKLNYIADFVKMKEELYEGEAAQIYQIQSFLVYKRFYRERINMMTALKLETSSCFILTNSQVTQEQLRLISNEKNCKSLISSLQQCNLLIEKSLIEYSYRIIEQSNEHIELGSLSLDTIKVKQTGYLMALLNTELENLIIKREQIIRKFTQREMSDLVILQNLSKQTSINLSIVEQQICQSDEYEAISFRGFSIMEIVFLLSELSGRKVKKYESNFELQDFQHYIKDYYGLFQQTILFFN